MKLFDLLSGVEIIQSKMENKDIKYICSDSRRAEKDYIFVALKGEKRNGNDYIKEAINNGCSCIITDDKNSFYEYENTILTHNARRALSILWNKYYGNPTRDIKLIGITGTNGKTSSAFYVYTILREVQKRVGLISTIKCLINDEEYGYGSGGETLDIVAAMTTPDPEFLYKIFYDMKKANVEYIVMEASSHALELSKLYPLEFEIGVFTNLSEEHLDFHKNINDYFLSKLKLFYNCKYAVINYDDSYAKQISRYINKDFITFGKNEESTFKISNIVKKIGGSVYNLIYKDEIINVEISIDGEFSIYNSSVGVNCAYLSGVDIDGIKSGAKKLKNICGRIERVKDNIYIDYAHTPVAMENVLKTVRQFSMGKQIIALFGCGGDRDKSKRSKMGEIASRLADVTIITSDNPRGENKMEIINDIKSGVNENTVFYIIPNRRDAIEFALKMMDNHILLLLGKGHEK
ncbi:MAG: UDP-N-acetylmuramoyl-L-alanyl-D-glutamate--2,6-diaminopimelate ligase, partial [Clostridia bacterium]|nr:UDP-N-acetylmuramoyl-L-alanyl-D-glutamate--2,6-diaminopimelate ligase [Clostridia bacterium]